MQIKKNPLLALLLIGASVSLQALPMVEEDELASFLKTEKRVNSADVVATHTSQARETTTNVRSATTSTTSYSNIAVSETASSMSIEDSSEALRQKIDEAKKATATWQQEDVRIAALPNIETEETERLQEQSLKAAVYWRQEQERYETIAEEFNKNKQSQERRAIRPVIDACEEAVEAAEQIQEKLSQRLKLSELQKITPDKSLITSIPPNPASATVGDSQSSNNNLLVGMEQPLRDEVESAVKKLVNSPAQNLQTHYKQADQAWKMRDDAWQELRASQQAFRRIDLQLTLSTKKLEDAKKAATDEESEKTILGKISKHAGTIAHGAGIVGAVLGIVPEPICQITGVAVAVGIGNVASNVKKGADTLSSVFVKYERSHLEAEKRGIFNQHTRAKISISKANEPLLQLEQTAEAQETFAARQLEETTTKIAEQLAPQKYWGESEWQAWGSLLGKTANWNQTQIFKAIKLAKADPSWVEDLAQKMWQQKINTAQEQLLALKKQSTLAGLEKCYGMALEQYEKTQAAEASQRRFLDMSQEEQAKLTSKIEQGVEELEKLSVVDRVQFDKKRKEFLEQWSQRERIQNSIQGFQKKWEEAALRNTEQSVKLFVASEAVEQAKKQEEKIAKRARLAYQVDRELLQRIWLRSAFDNYKEWSLPDFSSPEIKEYQLTDIDPPLQRTEEVEARGRSLQLQETMGKIVKSPMQEAMERIVKSSKQSNLSTNKKAATVSPVTLQSSFDQVQQWVLEKRQNLSNQTTSDKARWSLREKLDQLETTRRALKKKLEAETASSSSGQKIGGDFNDGKSEISKITASTEIAQTLFSSFNQKPGTVISFGGKTAVQKQPAPVNQESQAIPKKWRQLQEEIIDVKERYFELLDQAEKERLSQTNSTPFLNEIDCHDAWEKADLQYVKDLQKKRRNEELVVVAEEERSKWQLNTERWRMRAQADKAFKDFEQAMQKTLKLTEATAQEKTRIGITEARKKTEEAQLEENKLHEVWSAAETSWEKRAKEYREAGNSSEERQPDERMKERDRAVNSRWEKLLKKYQHPETELSIVEQDDISQRIMTLKDQLQQEYQSSFYKYGSDKSEALAHYRDKAFNHALQSARSYPTEMAEAWEKITSVNSSSLTEEQQINKEAEGVFKAESRRLEKIEKIWQGILDDEQQEKRDQREQAAFSYYRGNRIDWIKLDEQERVRYNDEVKKVNAEYDQKNQEKREGIIALIDLQEVEKQTIENRIEGVKNTLYFSSSAKEKDLAALRKNLKAVTAKIDKATQQLNQQEKQQSELYQVGLTFWQREKSKQAILRAQEAQSKSEKTRDQAVLSRFWEKSSQCNKKSSEAWIDACNSKLMAEQRQQKENSAIQRERAADSYEQAAKETINAGASQDASKQTLIAHYEEVAKTHIKLAGEQKNTTLIDKLEADLHYIEKKIGRLLCTKEAQIEELKESIPVLESRRAELLEEAMTLRQQGKEILAAKKEILAADLRDLFSTSQKALSDLLAETSNSREQAIKAIDLLHSIQKKDQELQEVVAQTVQLAEKIALLQERADYFQAEAAASQTRGELLLNQQEQELYERLKATLAKAQQLQNQLLTESKEPSPLFEKSIKELEGEQQYCLQFEESKPLYQLLDQKRNVFQAESETLKKEVATAEQQGQTFVAQRGNVLLHQLTCLLAETDQGAKKCMTKLDKISVLLDALQSKFADWEQHNQELQQALPLLSRLSDQKNILQTLNESLNKAITNCPWGLTKETPGRLYFLLEKQKKLFTEVTQTLSEIDQKAEESAVGTAEPSNEAVEFLVTKVKSLGEIAQLLECKMPKLLELDRKRTSFEARLTALPNEIANSLELYQGDSWLSEKQQSLVNEIAEVVSKIDPMVKQLMDEEQTVLQQAAAIEQADHLLTELARLEQEDQYLQEKVKIVQKLQRGKNLGEERLKALPYEIISSQSQEKTTLAKRQEASLEALRQTNQSIPGIIKQVFDGVDNVLEQEKDLFSQLIQLQREDQLQQKIVTLQHCIEALRAQIGSLNNNKEVLLAQNQQELLNEIMEIISSIDTRANQLCSEPSSTFEPSETLLEKIEKLNQCEITLDAAKDSAHQLNNAFNAINKATEVGKVEENRESAYYVENANQYRFLATYYQQAAKALAEGNVRDAWSWRVSSRSARYAALQLENATRALTEATKARENRIDNAADYYDRSASLLQISAEHYTKAAIAQGTGQASEGVESELDAASFAWKAAEELNSAALDTILQLKTQKYEGFSRWFSIENLNKDIINNNLLANKYMQFAITPKEANNSININNKLNYTWWLADDLNYKAGEEKRVTGFYNHLFNLGRQVITEHHQEEDIAKILKERSNVKDAAKAMLHWKKSFDYPTCGIYSEEYKNIGDAKKANQTYAELYKTAHEYNKKAIKARSLNNNKEAEHWRNVAIFEQNAVEQLNAIASINHQVELYKEVKYDEAVSCYNQISAQHNSLANLYKDVSSASQKNVNTDSWKDASSFLYCAALHLYTAADFVDKAMKAQRKGIDAQAERLLRAAYSYFPLVNNNIISVKRIIEDNLIEEPGMLLSVSELAGQLGRKFFLLAEEAKATPYHTNRIIHNKEDHVERDSAYYLKMSATWNENAIKAQEIGTPIKQKEAALWNKAAEQAKSISQDYIKDASYCLDKAATALRMADKAEQIKENEEATEWQEQAKQYEDIVDIYQQALHVKKSNEKKCLTNLCSAMTHRIETQYAEIAGKYEEAEKLFKKALESYQSKNIEVAICFNNAAVGYLRAAGAAEHAKKQEYLEKKLIVSQQWHAASLLNEQSVGCFIQAANNISNKAACESFGSAGHGFLATAQYVTLSEYYSEVKEKEEQATQWSEVIRLSRRSSELLSQAAQTYITGKTAEADLLKNAGDSYNNAAKQYIEAINNTTEAKSSDAQRSECHAAFQEAIRMNQMAAEQYTQAALAYEAGNKEEGDRLGSSSGIASRTEKAANSLTKRAECFKKAISQKSILNPGHANLWREAAMMSQQAASAYEEGRTGEGINFNNASINFFNAANSSYNAMNSREKATKAEQEGNKVLADRLREVALKYDTPIELFTGAARASAIGNSAESSRLHNEARGIFEQAYELSTSLEM